MATRIAVLSSAPPGPSAAAAVAQADLILDFAGDRANVLARLGSVLGPAPADVPTLARDLLDVAIAVYISDIAVPRGQQEQWTRDISLLLPVREVNFWQQAAGDLRRLLHALTRDNFSLSFYAREGPEAVGEGRELAGAIEPDCVSMLSGGLDSLAGAVTLQHSGRRPLYSLHRSGNPTVRAAQEHVLAVLARHWSECSVTVPYQVAPNTTATSLPFPQPEQREPSRRVRSLLFLAAAEVAAVARGLSEVYMFENGVLSAALPLTAARTGSLSTRSTHPTLLMLFNALCARAGLSARVSNPFVYQTKSELIRDVLRPVLSPAEIQGTVSCWAAGRAHRQCGGCVPCLLRRIGMLWAGLPDESYMIDIFREPARYAGTAAYGNLMDLLRSAAEMLASSDDQILLSHPELLALEPAGVSATEVIRMFRRHAEQVSAVVHEHFPEAARLMH